MNVQELIARLQEFPLEHLVIFRDEALNLHPVRCVYEDKHYSNNNGVKQDAVRLE